MSNKEIVIEAVRELPEEASFEEILEVIAIHASIRLSEKDLEEGRVVSQAEVRRRIALWVTK